MKLVKLKDKDGWMLPYLSMDKIYSVTNEEGDEYLIKNDDGDQDFYPKGYFDVINNQGE